MENIGHIDVERWHFEWDWSADSTFFRWNEGDVKEGKEDEEDEGGGGRGTLKVIRGRWYLIYEGKLGARILIQTRIGTEYSRWLAGYAPKIASFPEVFQSPKASDTTERSALEQGQAWWQCRLGASCKSGKDLGACDNGRIDLTRRGMSSQSSVRFN